MNLAIPALTATRSTKITKRKKKRKKKPKFRPPAKSSRSQGQNRSQRQLRWAVAEADRSLRAKLRRRKRRPRRRPRSPPKKQLKKQLEKQLKKRRRRRRPRSLPRRKKADAAVSYRSFWIITREAAAGEAAAFFVVPRARAPAVAMLSALVREGSCRHMAGRAQAVGGTRSADPQSWNTGGKTSRETFSSATLSLTLKCHLRPTTSRHLP